jgi:signal transduction histidine kinase
VSLGSLRVRLLLAAAISIFVALGLAAAGLAWLFERHVEHWLDAELEVQLNQLLAGIERAPGGEIEIAKPPADPRFGEPLSGLYWQVAIEPGGPVLRSRSLWDSQLALPSTPVGDELNRARLPGPGGSTLYVLERHVTLPANLGGSTAQAAIGLDVRELRAAVWRFTRALLPFLLIVGILLTAAAWAQVAIGLKPLARLRTALGAIRSGERTRLGGGFPDEVQPLAREIDSLLTAREAEVEKARARASDLAHGLKTPLQVLAGEAGRLKASGAGEAASSIEELAAGMQRHIDRHLARARLAGPADHVSTRVSEVAERVIDVVSRTPAGARLSWTNLVPADLFGCIDAEDLAEALGNLIENGAEHARSKLIVSGRGDGDFVALTVSDDGPGIPKARRDEALERGKSLDETGRGSGIGLAIVADIVEACGGTLSFEDRDHGFSVTLSIPRAQARPIAAPRARRKAV